MILERIYNFIIGSSGLIGTQLSGNIDPPAEPSQWPEIIKLIIQIVIALVTIYGILRPKTKRRR